MKKLSDLADILCLPLILIMKGGWVVLASFGVLWGIGRYFEILLLRQIANIFLLMTFGIFIILLFCVAVLLIADYVIKKYSKEYQDHLAAGAGRKSAFIKSSTKGFLVFLGLLAFAILWIYGRFFTESE